MPASRSFFRRDATDTLIASPAGGDALEQLARDDAADWTLLRLVLCTAAATVLLAVACGVAG